MEKHNIDIMGISEVRWKGEGELTSGDHKMIYKGGAKKEKGVGFIYKRSMDKNVMKIIPKSDRVIAVKMKTEPVDTLLIQVYMPTSRGTDEEVEEIYKQVEEIMNENGRGQNSCPIRHLYLAESEVSQCRLNSPSRFADNTDFWRTQAFVSKNFASPRPSTN
ncbi:hypothetical protein M8J75_003293 [Diaphorina citri]|nr:hypothetical protein M8J75_003293 [Diaphorina citri]